MKRLMILALAALLFLSACAANREKLSPRATVDLKSADVAYNQQNVEEALALYNKVLDEKEGNPNHAHALRRVADINLYYGETIAERAVEFNKNAFENYNKSISIMEKYEKPTEKELAAIRDMKKRRTSAWTRMFNAADTQLADGNTASAIEIFETVAAMDPSRTEPLYKLATIYQKDVKDEAKAEAILLKIYEVNPEDNTVQESMGIFYLNKKEYAAAIPFFEKVKQTEPLNVNNLMNLSYCQFELEQYEAAKLNNQMVLNIEPNNEDALADAKYIAFKLEDDAAAVGFLKRLLEIRDDDRDYQDISFLLNKMEDYQEMITYARKWHEYDGMNKDAVRLVILGAQKTSNKALETEFNNILKKMK
jgi:tetratricopeptide (TPR) repeat protein